MRINNNGVFCYDYKPKIKTWHADKDQPKKQILLTKLQQRIQFTKRFGRLRKIVFFKV